MLCYNQEQREMGGGIIAEGDVESRLGLLVFKMENLWLIYNNYFNKNKKELCFMCIYRQYIL